MYVQLSIPLAIVTAIAAFIVGGDPYARSLLWAAVAVFVAIAGAVLLASRRPEGLRNRHHAAFGGASIAVMAALCYYWGSLSAAIMVGPLAMVIVGGGDRFARVVAFSSVVSAVQVAFPVLIALDVLVDRAVVRPVDLSTAGVAAFLVTINVGFVTAVFLGRRIRAVDVATMEELHQTVAEVAARDALLYEAKEEIRRLRDGDPAGRYSEQEIGHYQLGHVVGRGAMGEVYEARHSQTGARAAVKLLYPHVLAQPALFKRFARELEAVASLNAPNIVKVLETPGPSAGGLPYLAMEFLEGSSLADILDERGSLGLVEVADLLRQIGSGLQAAHDSGIVHRDLKPHNLFRDANHPRGHVWKILDFGVCKIAHHSGSLTSGHALGTPGYMAPEQASDAQVDHRADIYSLGVVAYRCITGRAPFCAESHHGSMRRLLHDMPTRPSELAPVPRLVDDVLLVAMAKNPRLRFDSATEFGRAFEAACAGTAESSTSRRAASIAKGDRWTENRA